MVRRAAGERLSGDSRTADDRAADVQASLSGRRVALVHDWLTGMRGGEKCLEVLCELFPEADIHTLFHVPGTVSGPIADHRIHTSFLQRFPGIRRPDRHSQSSSW